MRIYILILFICLILTSCHHYYYVPTSHNVPLFREKNEFHLAGSYAVGDESKNGELQTAYSITDHVGIMTNFMRTKIGSIAEKNYVSSFSYDFGIGYFRPVGRSFVFEIYSGYGRNKQHHKYSKSFYNSTTSTYEYESAGESGLKCGRLFFQPSFGFASDHFDVTASLRLNNLWYTHIKYDVVDRPQDLAILIMLDKRNYFVYEPAITLRTGWRYFKVQLQASFADILYNEEEDEEFYNFVEGPHISCGLYLTLANRWNKKK